MSCLKRFVKFSFAGQTSFASISNYRVLRVVLFLPFGYDESRLKQNFFLQILKVENTTHHTSCLKFFENVCKFSFADDTKFAAIFSNYGGMLSRLYFLGMMRSKQKLDLLQYENLEHISP